MRRRSSNKRLILFIVALVIGLVIGFSNLFSNMGDQEPSDVVEDFYKAEQDGDFGSAWELFHPVMQKRFSKNAFVTERSHIYMSHYGVETFSYTLGKEAELENWKMAKDSKAFPVAHSFEVEQTFKSKFGTFIIKQKVYVVEVKEDWKIVWEY